MNERQMQLIMQIVREQMEDYLAKELADDIAAGIEEGLNDNQATLELLGLMEAEGRAERNETSGEKEEDQQ